MRASSWAGPNQSTGSPLYACSTIAATPMSTVDNDLLKSVQADGKGLNPWLSSKYHGHQNT
jgi:hypothetical protein